MKALVILSVMLNMVLAGALGAYYFMRTDDANWFYRYNLLNLDQRLIVQNATDIVAGVPENTETEFNKLLVNEELRKRYANAGTPEEIQPLLVAATLDRLSGLEEIKRESELTLDRIRPFIQDFRDFQQRLEAEKAQIEEMRRDFDERKRDFEDRARNESLNKLVQDIDKAKKVDTYTQRLLDRPVLDQIYVLHAIKDGQKRTALFNLLPPEQQSLIKEREITPLEAAGANIGQ